MKRHAPGWRLSDADGARLRALLDDVPEDCGQDDPRLIRLLDGYEAAVVDAPYAARPVLLAAYRTQSRAWLVGSVPVVLAAIAEIAGVPGASALDAYRESLAEG